VDLAGLLNALAVATNFIIQHGQVLIAGLVAAIILAYLVSGRGSQ
jgi:hypothetical protein